LLKIRNNIISV